MHSGLHARERIPVPGLARFVHRFPPTVPSRRRRSRAMFVLILCETLLVPAYFWAAALADGVCMLVGRSLAGPRAD
jgi:hypothetical protein